MADQKQRKGSLIWDFIALVGLSLQCVGLYQYLGWPLMSVIAGTELFGLAIIGALYAAR